MINVLRSEADVTRSTPKASREKHEAGRASVHFCHYLDVMNCHLCFCNSLGPVIFLLFNFHGFYVNKQTISCELKNEVISLHGLFRTELICLIFYAKKCHHIHYTLQKFGVSKMF